MTDDRFDQDLRSVLLADAPREVPDDLRRRVALISVTDPAAARPSRPAWRPLPLWVGALGVLLVALALGFSRFGLLLEPGVGDDQSPTPSAEPSTSPSGGALSSPSPSTATAACGAADLTGRILGWDGAAGSRIADVEISNATDHPCFVRGTPGLELVDAGGRVLIDSSTAGPSGLPNVTSTDPSFELAPGTQLRTDVAASNYCGPDPSSPIDIALTLPSGGGRLVAVPGPGVSSDLAVPPCLGPSASGQIGMNGWRR
jgi:hypothetical protein